MVTDDLGKYDISCADFISSDQHFGHRNVIKYCNRPFATTEDMDAAMISLWNSVVTKDDRVFVLGDLAFKGSGFKSNIIGRLNGSIILVKGNHDAGRARMVDSGCKAAHLMIEGVITDINKSFCMSHIPQVLLSKTCDVYFHGHVHEKFMYMEPNFYNVGCDLWDFTPQRIDHVIAHAMNRQKRLPNQVTMETWFEPRDAELTKKMYSTTEKEG